MEQHGREQMSLMSQVATLFGTAQHCTTLRIVGNV